MRTLVLLDLLGAKQPALTWHFENTRPLFGVMQSVESKLRILSLLRGQGGRRPTRHVSYPDRVGGDGDGKSAGGKATDAGAHAPYMSSNGRRGGLSDDHVPFMRKGIPVVHLIDSPFPSVTFDPTPQTLDPAPPVSTSSMPHAFWRESIS
jgi:glutaminyl-peptide cyclotransferase